MATGALGDQHESGPADRAAEGEGYAQRVEAPADVRREQHQPGRGQQDPKELRQAARGRNRQRERPDELDGDGDAQGNARDRLVEAEVHAGDHQA